MIQKEIYSYFANLVFEEAGIKYSEANYFQLDGRLKELAKYMELDSVEQVYEAFKKGAERPHKEFLIDVATNNETSFFRDKSPFEALPKLIEQLYNKNPKEKIKIWSAACSSGQEPYSLLIKIKEQCPHVFNAIDIYATDISQRILNRAKSGIYSQLEVQRGMPTPLLMKYFEKNQDDQWQISGELRNKVKFSHLNLFSESFPNGPFDIILCRNVLIYQTLEEKKRIIANIFNVLKPDGAFVTGSSENLFGVYDKFERTTVDKCTVYHHKESGGLAAVS